MIIKEQRDARIREESFEEILANTNGLCCITDASWISSTQQAVIGWILYNQNGHMHVNGWSIIQHTSSALEAEAEALRWVFLELNRLCYKGVTFYGDSVKLYHTLQNLHRRQRDGSWSHLKISVTIRDILQLCKSFEGYNFVNISRKANVKADNLAKYARKIPRTWLYLGTMMYVNVIKG